MKGFIINDSKFLKIEKSDLKIPSTEARNFKFYIIPGLIDAHLHITEEPENSLSSDFFLEEPIERAALRAKRNLEYALKFGITTVRDFGSFGIKSIKVREWLRREGLLSKLPRLLTTGGFITRKNGHAPERAIIIKQNDDPLNVVKQLIDLNVDGLKIINDPIVFSKAEMIRISDYAHNYSKPLAVHVFSDLSAQIALESDVDSIEHIGDFSLDTISKMSQKKSIVVPTFVAALDTVINPVESKADDLFEDTNLDLFKKWYKDECKTFPKLYKYGVKLACGTDSGLPGTNCGSLIREIMCWRMFNIPMDIILHSATQISGDAVGKGKQIGKIEEGYFADFNVYLDNPIINPAILFSPYQVWCSGNQLL